MMQIPTWWLILSAVFFVMNIIWFIGLTMAMLKIAEAVKQMTPNINALTQKVHDIGSKVEGLTTSLQTTVSSVGGRAKSVAGSADLIAHTASRQFEKFSPIIIGVLSTLRILKAVGEFRKGRSLAAATTQTATKPQPKSAKERAKLDKMDRK